MKTLIVLFAVVCACSAGLISTYPSYYPSVKVLPAVVPAVKLIAPATSYSNTYKVSHSVPVVSYHPAPIVYKAPLALGHIPYAYSYGLGHGHYY